MVLATCEQYIKHNIKTVIDGHIWWSIGAQSPFGHLAPKFQGDLWAEKIV